MSRKLRIGITGSHTYENMNEIKETIFKLKQTYGVDNLEIVSRGNYNGADKFVKKIALEFGFDYFEFVYQYSEKYDVRSLYTKYASKTRLIRDKAYAKYIDYLIVFFKEDDNVDNLVKYAEKFNKKVVIL